jgi:hypothetical protein
MCYMVCASTPLRMYTCETVSVEECIIYEGRTTYVYVLGNSEFNSNPVYCPCPTVLYVCRNKLSMHNYNYVYFCQSLEEESLWEDL